MADAFAWIDVGAPNIDAIRQCVHEHGPATVAVAYCGGPQRGLLWRRMSQAHARALCVRWSRVLIRADGVTIGVDEELIDADRQLAHDTYIGEL